MGYKEGKKLLKQISRDISSEKQPDSSLDTGFLVSYSESILHFETQNDHNISNFNEQSNNFPSFQNFDSCNNFSVSHDVELENFDNNLYNSDFENVQKIIWIVQNLKFFC
jgi:hypothetical protein